MMTVSIVCKLSPVIIGIGIYSLKENLGLDDSAVGAETVGVPKLNEAADEVAPKSNGGLLASCFGASLTGAISVGAVEALNKNDKEDSAGVEAYGSGREVIGEARDVTSIVPGAVLSGARTPNDILVLVEGLKIEILVDTGAAPNVEVAVGAADGVTDT
jgi:hypothetical protein